MYRCSHCTHDNDCMHTTIDGADQTAFGLPHFNQDDKCTTEGLKYKVCMIHLQCLVGVCSVHAISQLPILLFVLCRQSCTVQLHMVFALMLSYSRGTCQGAQM